MKTFYRKRQLKADLWVFLWTKSSKEIKTISLNCEKKRILFEEIKFEQNIFEQIQKNVFFVRKFVSRVWHVREHGDVCEVKWVDEVEQKRNSWKRKKDKWKNVSVHISNCYQEAVK